MTRLLFICVLGLAVGGCAIIHKPPTSEPGVVNAAAWQQRQSELAEFQNWSLQGRVATGQLLGWTGNLSWRERADHFDVRLAGPLGAGGMRAQGTLEQVTIDTDDGRHLVTNDPDALVEKALGWSFPLKPLRYWALGLPAPGDYQQISVDAKGRLKSLRQQGWRVAYLDYKKPRGVAVALPRRVVLDNGKTRIRLVIDRWFDLPANGSATAKDPAAAARNAKGSSDQPASS